MEVGEIQSCEDSIEVRMKMDHKTDQKTTYSTIESSVIETIFSSSSKQEQEQEQENGEKVVLKKELSANYGNIPPWEVREVDGKGKAAFSLGVFKKGSVVYSEIPTIRVPFHWPFTKDQVQEVERRVAAMNEADKKVFYDCANVYPDAETIASGIFYTNSFDTTDDTDITMPGQSCAMFCNLARLNHSCSPNGRQQYDIKTKREVLFAHKDINIGDEITDSYVDIELSVKERQSGLLDIFKFVCTCSRCIEESK